MTIGALRQTTQAGTSRPAVFRQANKVTRLNLPPNAEGLGPIGVRQSKCYSRNEILSMRPTSVSQHAHIRMCRGVAFWNRDLRPPASASGRTAFGRFCHLNTVVPRIVWSTSYCRCHRPVNVQML